MRRRQVLNKAAVDLHLGERKLAKLHQRRIAGAEIVDRETHTLDPEACERVHQPDEGLGGTLGQLQDEAVGRHAHFPTHSLDEVREFESLEANGRNVECEPGLKTLRAPNAPLAKGFA